VTGQGPATRPAEAPAPQPGSAARPARCRPAQAVLPFLLLAGTMLMTGVPPAAARDAPRQAGSLDAVPPLLRSPEARRTFAEQMQGRPAADRFGTALPPELPAARIEALLRSEADRAPLNTVGARALDGFSKVYAVLLCTGGSVPKRPGDDRCAGGAPEGDPPLRATLALVQARADGPRLVAPPLLFDGTVSWADSGLPDAPDEAGNAPDGRIAPESLAGFDPASYRLAPGEPAFGLRATWSQGYAGGMAQHGALYLFALVDGTLRQVFAAPMSAYRDTAGDWHPDGTRDHEITEGANVLVLAGRGSASHADLLLRRHDDPWKQMFRWDPATARYRPQEP